MTKHINWFSWFFSGVGGFWAIYLMITLPHGASGKEQLTASILFFVSLTLLEINIRQQS